MNLQLRYNFFFCFSEKNRLGFLESFLRNQDQFKNSDTVLEGVVGADAYIGPAECAVFMEIFSEFVTSQRADRVVGLYGETSMHIYPVGADDSVRPQNIPILR